MCCLIFDAPRSSGPSQFEILVQISMLYPFKILVDSRSAVLGHGGSFTVSLPETMHMKDDTALYVNNATLTNTVLSTGTAIGSDNIIFVGTGNGV